MDCILLGWVSRPSDYRSTITLGLVFYRSTSDYIYPACVPKCHSYNIAWECFHIESSE